MKRIVTIFIACLLPLSGNLAAQTIIYEETNPAEEPESSVTYNGASYSFFFDWKKNRERHLESHWTGIGFAFTDLANLDDGLLKGSKSYSVTLNLIDLSLPFHSHWLFASGIGIDWTRYHFKGGKGLEEVDGVTGFIPAPEGVQYKSSKLLTYYITIPLLLEYQTKLGRRTTFFVNGGAEVLIKCYSKSQIDIRNNDKIDKVNLGKDLNILPVNGRLRLQAGINDISLFGYYQPFSLFRDGEGPEVYPYAFGVSLCF